MPSPAIILLGFVIRAVLTDHESCEVVRPADLAASKVSLSLLSDPSSSIELAISNGYIEEATSAALFGDAKYNGFYCTSEPAASASLDPCKYYLHYADIQLRRFPRSLKCYRMVSEPDLSTTAIIVLNRLGEQTVYEDILRKDSYSFAVSVIDRLLDFALESINHMLPITDMSDDRFWMRGDNIVVDTSFGFKMLARYRFTDTALEHGAFQDRREKFIEQFFYFLKRFFYQRKSCKEIAMAIYDTEDWEHLHGSVPFPYNARSILAGLDGRVVPATESYFTTRDKQEVILRLYAKAYCFKKLSYNADTLKGLKEQTALLSTEDEMFERPGTAEAFLSYFSDQKRFDETSGFNEGRLKGTGAAFENYIKQEVDSEPAVFKRDREVLRPVFEDPREAYKRQKAQDSAETDAREQRELAGSAEERA